MHIKELAPDVGRTDGLDDAVPAEQLVEAGIAVSVDRAGKCLQVALRMLPFCDWASRRTVPLAGARPRAIT